MGSVRRPLISLILVGLCLGLGTPVAWTGPEEDRNLSDYWDRIRQQAQGVVELPGLQGPSPSIVDLSGLGQHAEHFQDIVILEPTGFFGDHMVGTFPQINAIHKRFPKARITFISPHAGFLRAPEWLTLVKMGPKDLTPDVSHFVQADGSQGGLVGSGKKDALEGANPYLKDILSKKSGSHTLVVLPGEQGITNCAGFCLSLEAPGAYDINDLDALTIHLRQSIREAVRSSGAAMIVGAISGPEVWVPPQHPVAKSPNYIAYRKALDHQALGLPPQTVSGRTVHDYSEFERRALFGDAARLEPGEAALPRHMLPNGIDDRAYAQFLNDSLARPGAPQVVVNLSGSPQKMATRSFDYSESLVRMVEDLAEGYSEANILIPEPEVPGGLPPKVVSRLQEEIQEAKRILRGNPALASRVAFLPRSHWINAVEDAHLVVSSDTGFVHFANAYRDPKTVVTFGRASGYWRMPGQPFLLDENPALLPRSGPGSLRAVSRSAYEVGGKSRGTRSLLGSVRRIMCGPDLPKP